MPEQLAHSLKARKVSFTELVWLLQTLHLDTHNNLKIFSKTHYPNT